MWTPKDVVEHPLYVVLVCFNVQRYKQRWKLYRDTVGRIRQAGAIPITVEAAINDREFALEDHGNPGPLTHDGRYKSYGPPPVLPAASLPPSRDGQDYLKIRVREYQELWLKENLFNLAVQHLPPDAKYVAFVDADTGFLRPDWVSETLHKLQQFHVVQMFSTAVDLSPTYDPLMVHRGFMWSHYNKLPAAWAKGRAPAYGSDEANEKLARGVNSWHPGFAWAWRREALDLVGGLLDFAVLGAADHHMALALIGHAEMSYPRDVHLNYARGVLEWQRLASKYIKGNVGFVDGTLAHYWHGAKANRRYKERWQILIDHRFDPLSDLHRDVRGVWRLTDEKPELRDEIRRYFLEREEDSIHVPPEEDRVLR